MRVAHHPKEGKSNYSHRNIKPNSARPSVIFFQSLEQHIRVDYPADYSLLRYSLILYPVFFIAKLYPEEKEIPPSPSIKGSGIWGKLYQLERKLEMLEKKSIILQLLIKSLTEKKRFPCKHSLF